jgi:hypothetical protein
VEQTSSNGILDGCHTDASRVALDVLKHLLKSGTANQLYLFTFEILMCCDVVERSELSLYGYSFHIFVVSFFSANQVSGY